jgi:hypothetical protein
MKPTNPILWQESKRKARAGKDGGEPGRWSPRKAAIARLEYETAGGKWEKTKAPKPKMFAAMRRTKSSK